jgi:SAM-dependent methyltransferase
VADLQVARSVHREAGVPFEVLVFPRNQIGCLDVVSASGIKAYRGAGGNPPVRGPLGPFRRAANLLRVVLARTPPVYRPTIDVRGLVNVPGSMLLLGRDGLRRHIPARNLQRMAFKGLERAVTEGAVFHLWFHPSNFAHDTAVQLQTLDAILAYAAELRRTGVLEIIPMGEIAERTRHGDAEVRQTREAAVRLHDQQAGKFVRWYDSMSQDVRSNAFTYGRAQMNEVLEPLLRSLPAGARVLDVGCGTGEQLRWMRSLGLDAIGVEPAANMRAAARALNPDTEIVDGTADRLPFPDGSFDLILSLEVIRYLAGEDGRNAYREMLRVLRPGGVLACSLVNRYALDGFYLFHHIKRLVAKAGLIGQPAHCEFTTPGATVRELTGAGWEKVDVHGRMFAPLRIAYKVHPKLGRALAAVVERGERWLADRPWHVPLAGHLLVVATAPRLSEPSASASANAQANPVRRSLLK